MPPPPNSTSCSHTGRCKKGNGSFNYRMVFKLDIRPGDDVRLKLSAWDRDIIGANDAIGSVNLSLKTFFKKAYVRGQAQVRPTS